MKHNAEYFALAIVNRYRQKPGYQQILKYITAKLEVYAKITSKELKQAKEEGYKEGQIYGYEKGFSAGIKTRNEAPIWPQYKIRCMYKARFLDIKISKIITDFGISHTTYYDRIRDGFSHKEALTGEKVD